MSWIDNPWVVILSGVATSLVAALHLGRAAYRLGYQHGERDTYERLHP